MKNHQILFSRRDFLKHFGKGLTGAALTAGLAQIPSWVMAQTIDDPPLRTRAARKGILFGAEAMQSELIADHEFATHFINECGILVPGNELKWHMLRPTSSGFNFQPADWLASFAQNANLQLRGHTLIWGDSLPAWFMNTVKDNNAASYLKDHIAAVAGRYAGQVHSWDVVNEPIMPWDGRSDGLRNSVWLKTLGPNYIDMAFEAAAAADPEALLVLNQNFLEYDAPKWTGFRTKTLQLLERLKSSNVPIHALGIQAHLRSDYGEFNQESFRNFLHEVANMGLMIMITELDVYDANLPLETGLRDSLVAGQYEEFLSVALNEPAVNTVITWGLSDKYTWYTDNGARADNSPVRPLPLDDGFNRKLAWKAMADVFDNKPPVKIKAPRDFHFKD